MVTHCLTFFDKSKKWAEAKAEAEIAFDLENPKLTLRTLHREYVRPSQEEMIDKFMEAKRVLGHKFDSVSTNMGQSIHDLIDLSVKDLTNLELENEDLLSFRDRMLAWNDLPTYEEADAVMPSEESFFSEENEHNEVDENDLEPSDYEMFEPDGNIWKTSDRDAFTYGHCGGALQVKDSLDWEYRASWPVCRAVRAMKDAKNMKQLGRFMNVGKSKISKWEDYKIFSDAREIAYERINFVGPKKPAY